MRCRRLKLPTLVVLRVQGLCWNHSIVYGKDFSMEIITGVADSLSV